MLSRCLLVCWPACPEARLQDQDVCAAIVCWAWRPSPVRAPPQQCLVLSRLPRKKAASPLGQVLLAVLCACFSSSLAGICRRGQQPQERQPLQMTLVLWRPRPLSSVLSLLFRPWSSWPNGHSSCHEVTPADISPHPLEVFVALTGVETLQRGWSSAREKPISLLPRQLLNPAPSPAPFALSTSPSGPPTLGFL